MPRTDKPASKIIKPLRGGQITIPFEFRQKLGIKEDTLIRVTLEGDELHLRKVELKEVSKGSPCRPEAEPNRQRVHSCLLSLQDILFT